MKHPNPPDCHYEGKVVLVTGGAGAIGSNLVRRLATAGAARILVLDNLLSGSILNVVDAHNVQFVLGDIRSDDDLRSIFRLRPSVVFHLAAFFANQNSVDNPTLCEEINGLGHIKVLEYATISNVCQRFVYTNSEGGAYGAGSDVPHVEGDVSIDLGSPYYISKMAGEMYTHFYHRQHGLPATCLRLFNSYGPGETPGMYRNVIPNFIYWALNGRALPLTGDSRIARDFVFVDDIVEAILRAGVVDAAIGRSINVATGTPTLIYDLAEKINKCTGNLAGTQVLQARRWDNRPVILGNNDLARELLDFEVTTSIDQGLEATIRWTRDNWDRVCTEAAFHPGMNPALQV